MRRVVSVEPAGFRLDGSDSLELNAAQDAVHGRRVALFATNCTNLQLGSTLKACPRCSWGVSHYFFSQTNICQPPAGRFPARS
jgi:hypothetical protein